jgi:Rrf2 family protein
MGLKFTRASDYGVRAMLHIGSLPNAGIALKDDIAEAQHIPPCFMAKILRQLVKCGLLDSTRGVHGGFGLAKAASEINLLNIVEGIEGPIHLTDCTLDPGKCSLAHRCSASDVWLELQDHMNAILRETTLERLLSSQRKNERTDLASRIRASRRTRRSRSRRRRKDS